MAIKHDELLDLIKTRFPNAQVNLVDFAGDNDHYRIEIRDDIFLGKSKLEQHRMVHKSLDEILKNRLHAIEIKTFSKEC